MQRTFLQEKSLNRSQDNAEKSLNVDLSAKSRLIPYSTAASMLGLNDLYMEERDACENYRMIFTVNPVCTNVLYNAITEPVFKEGSYSAVTLVDSTVETPIVERSDEQIFPNGIMNISGNPDNNNLIDQIFAIRDTELSSEKVGDFKYHCGYDIFNNHLLRTSEFNHVMMANDKKNEEVFNTIFDFAVDYSGKTVTRVINESEGPVKTLLHQDVRMYQLDNIRSMNTAFYDELRTVDGWYGFYNTGYINIPNGRLPKGDKSEISINKILNNETPCGFIDLYPDRSLYSFIPKVNRYKKRLERNWDCTIVYPFKSDQDMFNRVMLNFSGTTDEWEEWKNVEANQKKIPNSVRVLNAKIVYNNVGDELVQMHSVLRHTLEPGDTIRLFYAKVNPETSEFDEIIRYVVPVRVVSIGDTEGNEENRYFTIKLSDINTFCDVIPTDTQTDEEHQTSTPEKELGYRDSDGTIKPTIMFFYRKIENGYDNKYYFRKFKQLKNYQYVQSLTEIPGAKVINREPTIVSEDSFDAIQIGDEFFYKISKPLTYTQNKIAFGENIYGDRVAQVIFNDDICVTGLKDNLGRPLTEVYFTVAKTNRGHDEWYNSGLTTDDLVEFSHCFGEVTSGLDLPEDENAVDFNVRKLHNVFTGQCAEPETYLTGLTIAMEDAPKGHYTDDTPLPIESGITLEDIDEFYGDIVEFSKTNFKETVIEKMYHRFNTAQRECLLNKNYFSVNYDEIVGDLYDVDKIE